MASYAARYQGELGAASGPKVPAPGPVLGCYPQREDAHRSHNLFRRLALPLYGLVSAWPQSMEDFIRSVRSQEQAFAGLRSREVPDRLFTLRACLARDGLTENLVARAFGMLCVMCAGTLGMRPHDTQLIGARIMLGRRLAEMQTGEGKTLTAGLAAAVAALAGVPVHVVTANDYLVQRDADKMRPLMTALGLSVGSVTQPMAREQRSDAYRCNITYCTAKELVFDYLRDCIMHAEADSCKVSGGGIARSTKLLRGLCMAIVDEADAVLIDEACVPLVLSRASHGRDDKAALRGAWMSAQDLECGRDFELNSGSAGVRLTQRGRCSLQEKFHAASSSMPLRRMEELVVMALTALHMMQCDREYQIAQGKVMMIDAITGRIAAGRTWSGGLHQMLELKEGCALTEPVETQAQITYQRFFPRYHWLCGMSGTLAEARAEMLEIYGLEIRRVPLQRPSKRLFKGSAVHASLDQQWLAVVQRVTTLHEAGRAVLVGTDSIAQSNALSLRLTAAGLPHEVLNASQDTREADIVAMAGRPGAITVATNMAGRGTDIAVAPEVAASGGLHVISCQQNISPRIDRQLFGRCARQGDPGSAERTIALDGALLAKHPAALLLRRANSGKVLTELLGRTLFRRVQKAQERRLRRERRALLRRDREMSRWFAFGAHKI